MALENQTSGPHQPETEPHKVEPSKIEKGFSLVEVITAMLILTVGIASMLTLFGTAIGYMQSAQEDLICKQKARDAMESIYTARESSQLTFDNIQNTSTSPGVFLTGYRNLTISGSDGLVGTTDDGAIENIVLPGNDGILGTSDDITMYLVNYKRLINITPVVIGGVNSGDIRQLQVTVQFNDSKGRVRSYSVTSLISRYR